MAAVALEPWQTAAPRKRRSAARRPQPREAAAAPSRDAEPEVDSGVVLRGIQKAREDLLLSDFWSSALETINGCLTKQLEQLKTPVEPLSGAFGNLHLDSPPDESNVAPGSIPGETLATGTCSWKCVCYGIGNFSTCVIARNQLTFLLLFLEKCQIPRSHCWVYDPLFSQLEIAVLSSLRLIVLSENEVSDLGKGSGEAVVNHTHSTWLLLTRILHKNYGYIAKILKGLEEHQFPQTSQYTDVFNDTSIHWFPVQRLNQLSMDTWAFREEPDYQDCEDLEIIRNKTEDPSTTDSNLL
ncbi:SRR1-like protein [Pteropus vampyrus]|uniref:SRR1-like protein n=1 Tax=Pteropus vampyrus TaxID=132908 RepID=A0A6P6BLJ8_PTEVA|nr:SRR1-like protein [Pteropus vampyrus]